MYSNLITILLPLFIGYLIHFPHKQLLQFVNRSLSWMVYIILFFMGVSLSLLDNLDANIKMVFTYTGLFSGFILIANAIALVLLSRYLKWSFVTKNAYSVPRWKLFLESLLLCGVVAFGFLCGLTKWFIFLYAEKISETALIILLFLVGLQLRNNGINLRQVILNRNGLMISLVVAVSALLGGALAALAIDLPARSGMAMASGYGWYSLSGSMLTKSLGPVLGSAAFFNDLIRELLAIMLIPVLIKKNPTIALGMCGATSMDFTLPMLQRSGGVAIVPVAIVHGFILSLLAPVFMALFSQ